MIHVGVAGWDYPDWSGPVYPTDAGGKFDRLAHVARFVDLIEINSSFYRPVAPRVAAGWLRRVADRPGFRFTAKAHRSWTHERSIDVEASVRATLDGLAPLRDGGILGALLVQFPQSFHFNPASLEHLARLAERIDGWPAVVEVRHRSWDDERARSWLEGRGIGWRAVDQPQVGRSTLDILPHVTSRVGYLRLHGRNTRDWFRPDAGRDARYDYLYTTDELGAVAESIGRIDAAAAEVHVVQNNHFRGQALVNALQLKRILGGRPPRAPQQLVEHYPQLADFVQIERTRLF